MSSDAFERWATREEDRIMKDYVAGILSREEYNAEMREIQRQAREAYEQDREDAMRRVDEEWGV